MTKHIKIKSVNGAECIVFTEHIISIQQSKDTGGAYIHFSNKKATILTIETYQEILKILGFA